MGEVLRSGRARLGVLSAFVLVLVAIIPGVTGATPAVATLFTSTTAGTYTVPVPAGVTSVSITAVGGAGGNDTCISTGTVSGGQAAVVTSAAAVSPGDTLTVTVAENGADGVFPPSPADCVGGAGGSGAGTGGSAASSLGGGGGGGGSAVIDATTSTDLVVAGGGGGGLGGAGGDAGQDGADFGGLAGSGGVAGGQTGPGTAGEDTPLSPPHASPVPCSQAGDGSGMNGGYSGYGGGGGGGYFGGGGGCDYGGGGGGSSYPAGAVTGFDSTATPSVTISYTVAPQDTTAPTDAPVVTGTLGSNGWYTTDVSVAWNWTDELGGSGIDTANCTQSSDSSGEGAAVVVLSSCQDMAGNPASDSLSFAIDKTAPAASPAQSPAANGAGWNNTDVTVHFNWVDPVGGSGLGALSTCATPSASTGEGTIVLTESCTDLAGNTGSANYSVKVDKTPPAVSVTGVTNGGQYLFGVVPVAGCNSSDTGGSGVATAASVQVTTTGSGGVGSFTATCSGAVDNAGNPQAAPVQVTYTVTPATTSLQYTGAVQFAVGTSFTPTATLGAAGACLSGQPVTFSFSTNPLTGAATSYQLGAIVNSSAGAVTGTTLSTTGWKSGVYMLTASTPGAGGCGPTSTSASVTVTVPGEVAFGGGWYTPSLGATSFGFFVVPGKSKGTYTGQLNLVTPGKWWLQANITGYVKAGTQGQLTGTGNLYWWNATLNHGHGGWVLAKSGVAYKAIANASTKTSPASFGITISYSPTAGQPGSLPNSSPLTVSRGGITIS